MKPIAFLVAALFLFHVDSDAQLIRSFGIKAGESFANQDWNYSGSSSFNNGYYTTLEAGAFIEWLNVPLVSILTEVDYIQKGTDGRFIMAAGSWPPQPLVGYYSFSPRVDYLSIPVMAKARFHVGVISPYVFAGPRLDILLSSGGEFFGWTFEYGKLDIGATMGVGAELPSVMPFKLGAEFRYSPDFQDSYSKSPFAIRNRAMEVLVVLGI